MTNYLILGVLFCLSSHSNAQNIAIYNAYIKEMPKVITPAIGNSNAWGHEPNVVFELNYDIKEKLKLGLRYYYDDYPGYIGYRWSPSDTNIAQSGFGIGGVKMVRFGLFGQYNMIELWKKIGLNLKVHLDYQDYNPQFNQFNIRRKVDDIRGLNYSGPDTGETFLTVYDKSQILPSIGLSLSYRPFWKVILHAEAFYSHGFVTHSRLEFEYTDLEVVQPTAEYVGNGTSFTYAFGIGFRLWE